MSDFGRLFNFQTKNKTFKIWIWVPCFASTGGWGRLPGGASKKKHNIKHTWFIIFSCGDPYKWLLILNKHLNKSLTWIVDMKTHKNECFILTCMIWTPISHQLFHPNKMIISMKSHHQLLLKVVYCQECWWFTGYNVANLFLFLSEIAPFWNMAKGHIISNF